MADGAMLTRWFIAVVVALVVAFDLFIIHRHGKEASISVVLFAWSRANPIIPFAFGLIFGHIFWNR